MDVKYNTDTKIEDNSRAFKLQKANFDKEVNTAVSNNRWLRVYRSLTPLGYPHFPESTFIRNSFCNVPYFFRKLKPN